jgi:pre-mycofactocin synthase
VGLAANGQAGVENVLDILRGGIDSALRSLGTASVRDLTPDDVVVPPGFAHIPGVLTRPAAPDRHARQDSARTPQPPRKI